MVIVALVWCELCVIAPRQKLLQIFVHTKYDQRLEQPTGTFIRHKRQQQIQERNQQALPQTKQHQATHRNHYYLLVLPLLGKLGSKPTRQDKTRSRELPRHDPAK